MGQEVPTMDSVSNLSPNNVTIRLGPLPGLMSQAVFWRVMSVILGLDVVAGVLATGANIVTIIVYFNMGFSDSTHISLTALAISDLGIALTAITNCLAHILPAFLDVSFKTAVFLPTSVYPHMLLTRISALITTYISVERYLCVLLPLKIKSIITPRRTFVAMLIIYGSVFGLYPAALIRFPLGWEFDPVKNKSVLGIIPNTSPTALLFGNILLSILSTFIPLPTFITVTVCTILLSLRLQKSKAWRDSNNRYGSESTEKQSKEARAVKMVITIATVFIIASIPSCTHKFIRMAVPGFNTEGRYSRMYYLAGMSFVGVNSINGGANVIIYYRMSRKFRHALLGLFGRRADATGETTKRKRLGFK